VEVVGAMPETLESHITQTYLVREPGTEVRLRRRSWGGKTSNVLKTQKRTPDNELIETERLVTNALYESLLQQADPYRQTIDKHRQSFIWHGQFFELDTYQDALQGLVILETKGIADQEDVNFPPFIRVKKDITGNPAYNNFNLALRNQHSTL
jgi:CYTH domain-containing protein